MKFEFPITIDNGHGEVIKFKEIVNEPDGDKLILEGRIMPNCGPVMHVHHKQDENFYVVQGKMAYQTLGGGTEYLTEGQSTTFFRNQPHKFWNADEKELIVSCWIKPANNAVFYLSTLYNATKNQKTTDPEPFDGAFLMKKYSSEYSILEMPALVKKLIIPIIYFIGKLFGKYKKYKNAPEPV